MAPANPVLIEVSRGAAVESRHRGAAVVVDSRGGRRAAWGDVDAIVFPRSSVKPLQALPLLESGAAARFGVSARELALACASHSGEPDHVAAARGWLARLGRREEDLICGPHPPISREAAEALIRIGREPSPLHNNCSGKHLGFLTLAMHLGAPLKDYGHPEHPVQREVRRVLSEMGGTDLASAPVAGDGCGAPVVAMPLVAIARAFALLAAPDDLPRARATAARRVVSAMTAHPYFVGGTGRFDTLVTERAAGGILVKGGAEGVCAAALLERGLGFAVKIDDGAKRAAETAMAALLARWADGDGALRETIAAFQATSVVDTRSLSVGSIRPAPGWPS
ncbi:MAG: asparaginase [Bacteroidota bacterium]